ncbi:MAG TPA: PIN domain-containing protein, partial [Thermoplasmata archaeon]
ARTLYEFFVDTCDIEFVERDLLEEAMAHHLRYDGVLSVPDCMSVTLMDRREIREIASFDADFDKVRGIRRIH